MKSLVFVILFSLLFSIAKAEVNVGCVVSLKTPDQMLMNDLALTNNTNGKLQLRGDLAGYRFSVLVNPAKSALKVVTKSLMPEAPLTLTTYVPLSSNSYRPRLTLQFPQGRFDLRCRKWSI